MKVTDFKVQFSRENILHLIDCYEDSPIYEEVLEEYERMTQEAYERMEPAAVLEFGKIPKEAASPAAPEGTRALFLIVTVGKRISEWSSALFGEGRYLEGMLADAFADDYLMQASESLQPLVRSICGEKQLGISRRLEAPTGIGMEAQKAAYEATDAGPILGMDITGSFMLSPVKSTCQIYLLKENSTEYHMDHNCRECPNKDCKMRHVAPIRLEVRTNGESHILISRDEKTVLEILREQGIYVPAVCAGRGSCGKCRIRVAEGEAAVTPSDERIFTPQQLSQGYRLACTCYPIGDMTVVTEEEAEKKMDIIGTISHRKTDGMEADGSGPVMVGIDIGTTTIAMELVDMDSGAEIDSYLCINRQRRYGADVISRIQASVEGKKEELQESIRQDLFTGLEKLTRGGEIVPEKVVIAGNTTMIHLLMGYPCDTLGVYPFIPHQIQKIESTLGEILGENVTEPPRTAWLCTVQMYRTKVWILPGISTFVGADIVSDILSCGLAESEKVSMLIDLGTNGEMGIGNRERILVTSTAAGPAFEGGNIVHGSGSIPGAICNVEIEDGRARVRTIQNEPPSGICGTGAIETLYELLQAGLVDETGLLEEDYEEDGFELAKGRDGEPICFYQKDIRELQLAKSAVRAGLETLLLRYEISPEDVDKVYLAGGFGYRMDVEKAVGIGLIPEVFADKIRVIGNGALEGAVRYGREEGAMDLAEDIVKISSEIGLSSDKAFNDLYMKHMYFECS